ncbi:MULTISPECIES: hypothetical protein [unclassified Streptomyces]|uniref:hypothetical protein n=1 Tax=Streptomyces sp. IBTA2 TaxID=2283625 RepID=UPI001EFE184F|nr:MULTISPECIES: hypothetical protein [unclassified Streptomyces]
MRMSAAAIRARNGTACADASYTEPWCRDAPVQLALCLVGRRVVVPGEGTQTAGDVLGAAVGVAVGRPGQGVQIGAEQGVVEVHAPDHGSHH